MAKWLRVLDLKPGGPWPKFSTLPLAGVMLGSIVLGCSVYLLVSHQLGFLITVYNISTVLLNTLVLEVIFFNNNYTNLPYLDSKI